MIMSYICGMDFIYATMLIALVIGIPAFIIQMLAKSALKRINHNEAVKESKKRIESNPYVQQHKAKLKNDELYDEYMGWAAKHGEGVPVPKLVTKEDAEAEKKIKRLF